MLLNAIRFCKGVLYHLEKAMWKMIYKHCSDLFKLNLKTIRIASSFSAHLFQVPFFPLNLFANL